MAPHRPGHPADHRLRPGEVVDHRYIIESFVAQGGMGTIYKARHIHIQRHCALKVMSSIPSDIHIEEFQRRFLAEAQAAARINDPAVITIYDFGFLEQTGSPYIAMEWMEGHNLAAELDVNGPMQPHRAAARFAEVLRGLAVAHGHSIIHKDIKPENLFLANPGTPNEMLRMVDFGIARLNAQANEGLTRAGEFVGTPRYLSPEYIAYNVVTPAMDVYAMGIVLVEMLTGEPVVPSGSAIQMMVAHSRGELNIPAYLRTSPLGPVIERATATRIEDRFPNANAFLEAFRAAQGEFLRTVELGPVQRSISSGSLPAVRTPTPPQAHAHGQAHTVFGAPGAASHQPPSALASSSFPNLGTVLSSRPPMTDAHARPAEHPQAPSSDAAGWRVPTPPGQPRPRAQADVPSSASTSTDNLLRPPMDDPESSEFVEMFRNATQAYVRRDYDKALEIFEECARRRPADNRIRHNITMINARRSRAKPQE